MVAQLVSPLEVEAPREETQGILVQCLALWSRHASRPAIVSNP